jgi:hypothetical protein
MALQLTSEQEERIRSVVKTRAYLSAEEALDAAVAAVGVAAAPGFEGTMDELEELLLEGLNSGEPVLADENFWNRLRTKTDKAGFEPGNSPPGVRSRTPIGAKSPSRSHS